MASVPLEQTAPTVSSEQLQALQSTVSDFGREQLIWSSGFLAGLASSSAPQALTLAPVPAAVPASAEWTVFFATETGNSRTLAKALAERAGQSGIAVKLQDLATYKPRNLARVENAVFVLATHGIGEPPEGSEAFFEYWLSDKAPKLPALNYSVLALGDSSYADFCEIGRVLDERLRTLGATSVVERVDCDLDFDDPAKRWSDGFIRHAQSTSTVVSLPQVESSPAIVSSYNRQNPFAAEVLTRQLITGPASSKAVHHIELDLEGSGLSYLPGDSLAVLPQNPTEIVAQLLESLRLSGSETVAVAEQELPIHEALISYREVTQLSRPVLDVVGQQRADIRRVLDDREQFSEFLRTRQLIDLVNDFPVDWEPQAFVDALRKLAPRSYSIASSPDANPGEVHLTVAAVDYEDFGRRHLGAASNYLAGEALHAPVFIETNQNFRLPQSGDTPIIMIGAGTGVAPYRAFIEDRREHGHSGDNWLIFGERTFANDFLYQLEWLRYRKEGVLNRLDLAFSRDQASKVYVQHKIIENGKRVYDWLQNGAHVYVCGDAYAMAGDVHAALLALVSKHGDVSSESAEEYLDELKRAKRYQRDVY